MKLICPSCGAVAAADVWANDAVTREAIMAIAKLPPPMHLATLRYLTLFRPGKSALSWKRVLRLVGEVSALAAAGYVSVQGRIDRDCPPRIWAAAMDEMVERRSAIKRPLRNHNYLRQVAHGLAEAEAVKRENEIHAAEQAGVAPRTSEPVSMEEMLADLTPAEIARLPEHIRDKYGVGAPHATPEDAGATQPGQDEVE